MDSVLNGRIAALGLIPIDKKAYIKYLKSHALLNGVSYANTNKRFIGKR